MNSARQAALSFLCPALAKNRTLTALRLSGNKLRAEDLACYVPAAISLADALRVNDTLVSLDIQHASCALRQRSSSAPANVLLVPCCGWGSVDEDRGANTPFCPDRGCVMRTAYASTA